MSSVGGAAVRRAEAHDEWRAPWPGVLVPTARMADPMTVIAAALAYSGEQGVVTGWTAAWLHGVRAVDPLPVHVAVPYGHWLRRRPGLVVHNGRRLDDDRAEVDGLSVLPLDRVLADLLCRDRPQDAFAVLDEALVRAGEQRRESLRDLVRTRVTERSDPRGRTRAGRLLDMATGRVLSPAESRIQFRLVDLGFPAPEVNHPVLGVDGQVLFLLDHAWPEYRIAVEYDGHVAHAGREIPDAIRQRELERRGYLVIRVRAADMSDVTRIEQGLTDAFRARGFPLRRRPGVLQSRRHRERRG